MLLNLIVTIRDGYVMPMGIDSLFTDEVGNGPTMDVGGQEV